MHKQYEDDLGPLRAEHKQLSDAMQELQCQLEEAARKQQVRSSRQHTNKTNCCSTQNVCIGACA